MGSDPFLGEIMLFAGNFAPRGYAYCQGQVLSISQNTALFSILGTTYGGNGLSTFALPDLRGRTPIQTGQGPGLVQYELGEIGGQEQVTLTISNLPAHTHPIGAAETGATDTNPNGKVCAETDEKAYAATANVNMAATGATGTGTPLENRMPYLGLNYCIALEGIFPSRS